MSFSPRPRYTVAAHHVMRANGGGQGSAAAPVVVVREVRRTNDKSVQPLAPVTFAARCHLPRIRLSVKRQNGQPTAAARTAGTAFNPRPPRQSLPVLEAGWWWRRAYAMR